MIQQDVADALEERRTETGEQRLCAALLELALRDARDGHADAIAWLESDAATVRNGFAFVQVCDELGLSPEWARQQVDHGARARRPAMRRTRRLRAAA